MMDGLMDAALSIAMRGVVLLNQHCEQEEKNFICFRGSFYILRGEADIISINWGDFD